MKSQRKINLAIRKKHTSYTQDLWDQWVPEVEKLNWWHVADILTQTAVSVTEAKFAFKSINPLIQVHKNTFSYNLELEIQLQKTGFCFLHFYDVMQTG